MTEFESSGSLPPEPPSPVPEPGQASANTPPPTRTRAPGQPPSGRLFLGLLCLSLLVGLTQIIRGPIAESSDTKQTKGSSTNFGWLGGSEGIGVVNVNGVIQFDLKDDFLPFGPAKGASGVIKQLNAFKEDKRVKAVVIRVNSPGGTVAASQEINQAVRKLVEANKPVVISMADVAASGGYYISAPASFIYCNPGTLTGSIGVISQLPKYYQLMEKVGVSFHAIHAGKWKDMGDPSRPFKEGEEALFQAMVDGAWEQFVDAVHQGRVTSIAEESADSPTGRVQKLADRDAVAAVATGQVYSGKEAMDLGLVDALGSFEDAIKKAGELVGIEDPEIIKPQSGGLSDFIAGLSAQTAAPASNLKLEIPLMGNAPHVPVLYMMPGYL